MNIQPRRFILVLVAVLGTVCGQAQAAFTDMVVIGDSLSDQGNVFILSGSIPVVPLTPPPEYSEIRAGQF